MVEREVFEAISELNILTDEITQVRETFIESVKEVPLPGDNKESFIEDYTQSSACLIDMHNELIGYFLEEIQKIRAT